MVPLTLFVIFIYMLINHSNNDITTVLRLAREALEDDTSGNDTFCQLKIDETRFNMDNKNVSFDCSALEKNHCNKTFTRLNIYLTIMQNKLHCQAFKM